MANRKNITNNKVDRKVVTEKEKKTSVDSGNNVPKELSEAQKAFRYIREYVYDIGRDKLGAAIGLFDGTTIKNYETKPGYNISLDTLIKCAEYFSTIPNVNNEINHISLDYLLGRTKHTSVITEKISEITGLDDNSINILARLNQDDKDRMIYNAEHLLDEFVYPQPTRLATINFVIKSEYLKALCDTLNDYLNPGDYEQIIAGNNSGYQYATDLFAKSKNGLVKPLNIKTILSRDKANTKYALDELLVNLSNEYEKKSRLDNDPICKPIFDELYKMGASYDEIVDVLKETIKDTPEIEKKTKKLVDDYIKKHKSKKMI